jgi:hypothetical protein
MGARKRLIRVDSEFELRQGYKVGPYKLKRLQNHAMSGLTKRAARLGGREDRVCRCCPVAAFLRRITSRTPSSEHPQQQRW